MTTFTGPTRESITAQFGAKTIERGAAYHRSGYVLSSKTASDRGAFQAHVRGSGGQTYNTTVEFDPACGELIDTDCTCPVGYRCKHAAALALTHEHSATVFTMPPRNAVATPGSRVAPALRPALQVVVNAEPGVGVFAQVRATASGDHVDWREFATRSPWPAWRPAQDAALRSALALLTSRAGRWARTDQVALSAMDPASLTPALRELADGDVDLVDATTGHVVQVRGADVHLDVTRDGSDLLIRAVVSVGGDPLDLTGAIPLGLGGATGRYLQTAPGGPMLVTLPPALPAFIRPLLGAAPRRVEAEDVDEFLHGHGPQLAREITLRSSDGSVTPPVAPQIHFVITVTGTGEPHRAEVTARWAEVTPAGTVLEPSSKSPPLTPERELEVRGRFDQALATTAGGSGASKLRHMAAGWSRNGFLAGRDLLDLVENVLPALRVVDGVHVVTAGLADYRQAAGDVEVTVTDAGSDRDWFDLQLAVSVDGHPVPLGDLLVALDTGQDTLVLDGGLWVRINTPALDRLRDLLEQAKAMGEPTAKTSATVRVPSLDVDAWQELADLGVAVEQATAWTAALQRIETLTNPAPVPVPATVNATLRDYQRAGFSWLVRLTGAGLGGILADDMGLGKTVQILTWMDHWRTTAQGTTGPVLVIAPTSMVETWASEAARFVPHRVVRTVTSTATRRQGTLGELAADADVVVTSYQLLRLEAAKYQQVEWSAVVADEAQAVKNPASKTYAAVRRLHTPVKIAVTGTPLENSLLDVWALLGLTAPGLFPTKVGFTRAFRTPIERHHDNDRLLALRRKLRPLMLRRTRENVALDLPPRIEQVVTVDLAPAHRAAYDKLATRERALILALLGDFTAHRVQILAALMRLRRMAIDPALVDAQWAKVPATKLDRLEDMIAEVVAGGHRALVFSQFTDVLAGVRNRLVAAGVDYAYLDGSTTRRGKVINAFRAGDAPVFLISLKAGGVGLTLTEADYVIVTDPWWNPAAENQAVGRAHRFGQTSTVMVYRLVARGTIEEKVMALKKDKAALFDALLDGGDLTGSPITAKDVAELLAV